MRGWTSWDTRVALRAAAIAAAALVLAWVVTAASDEGGLRWGERAGRALPFAPVCAAVGTWLALASGRARGEERALAAIGRSPWQRHAAAIVGGAAIAALAAMGLASSAVDVRGFYPRPERHALWHSVPGGGFAMADGRWTIDRDGAPVAGAAARTAPDDPSPANDPPPRSARVAASLATALLGLALPALVAAARRRTLPAVIAGALATSFAMVLAFQAAAAERSPSMLAPVAPLLLLAAAASLYATERPWRRAKSPK